MELQEKQNQCLPLKNKMCEKLYKIVKGFHNEAPQII